MALPSHSDSSRYILVSSEGKTLLQINCRKHISRFQTPRFQVSCKFFITEESTLKASSKAMTDFTFLSLIRNHRGQGTYYVYTIQIKIVPPSQFTAADQSDTISDCKWSVEHRYTTLAELHEDLLGYNDDLTRNRKRISASDHEEQFLAHPCLPRPFPCLEDIPFPRRRLLSTIHPPSVYPWLSCARTIPDKRDKPVLPGQSKRVDQRKNALETYLNELVTLIWTTVQTTEVANIVHSIVLRDLPQEACGADQWKCLMDARQIQRWLITLLPVFSKSKLDKIN
ncbi:hypothetical protein CLF_103308 [Clonorchis sinensis]|uniref:PX domain-containing protein n=1 Tax=Clonorchis sinensis TaxID=79923 RepID=G7Y9J1_CLOSI|nr:hypothetical protein CLF_103308 [Clonorchis sinensis]